MVPPDQFVCKWRRRYLIKKNEAREGALTEVQVKQRFM